MTDTEYGDEIFEHKIKGLTAELAQARLEGSASWDRMCQYRDERDEARAEVERLTKSEIKCLYCGKRDRFLSMDMWHCPDCLQTTPKSVEDKMLEPWTAQSARIERRVRAELEKRFPMGVASTLTATIMAAVREV